MKRVIFVLSFLVAVTNISLAQKSPVFTTSEGAINGYDPVAYFKESKPVKGNSKLSYSWNGVNWVFSNQQNLDTFKANPAKYAPQYGGYCAYGTAENHKAPTDPQAWTIVNDKLYLNYNKDVKALWNKDQTEFIIKADKNWPVLKDKE